MITQQRPRNYLCGHAFIATLVLATSVMHGCHSSNSGANALFPVSGVITFEGKPASGIVVQLLPTTSANISVKATDSYPGGVTDENGAFAITSVEPGDGAPEGSYKLVLFWPPDESSSDTLSSQSDHGNSHASSEYRGPPDRFFGKYFDRNNSKWDVTVIEGPNVIPVIDL